MPLLQPKLLPLSKEVDKDVLLQSIVKRETRGEKDPFIFTRVDGKSKNKDPDLRFKENLKAIRDDLATAKENREKTGKLSLNVKLSSAFGPAQITYTLANAVRKKNPNIDEGFKEYLDAFIKEGENRINAYRWKTGAVPDKYKGGGKGAITQEKHDKYYNRLTQLALGEKLRILTEQGKPLTVENISGAWYGGEADAIKEYTDAVGEYYNEIMGRKNALLRTLI
jgi:hypothetical protein